MDVLHDPRQGRVMVRHSGIEVMARYSCDPAELRHQVRRLVATSPKRMVMERLADEIDKVRTNSPRTGEDPPQHLTTGGGHRIVVPTWY